jgi:hypothetical protein
LVPKLATVLAADPRIAAFAVTSGNPMKSTFADARRVAAAPLAGHAASGTRYTFVSPEFFALMRMPVDRGRPFGADEARSGAPVAIVSAATASAFWPGQDPIGQTIRLEPPNGRPLADLPGYTTVTVVGTTRDVVSGLLFDGPDPGHIYFPITAASPYATALLMRGRTDAETAARVTHDLFARIGVEGQAFEVLPLDELRAVQLYPLQLASIVGTLLGAIALVLSVAGLYGLLTYTVNQRTREIGIRMAVGATPLAVVSLVMRQSLRLAGIGALLGLAIAFAAMQALNSAISFASVSMVDLTAFAVGVLLVLSATAISAFQPVRRATRVDPATTLRADA